MNGRFQQPLSTRSLIDDKGEAVPGRVLTFGRGGTDPKPEVNVSYGANKGF